MTDRARSSLPFVGQRRSARLDVDPAVHLLPEPVSSLLAKRSWTHYM